MGTGGREIKTQFKTDTQPEIAVIVPVYNCAQYLRQCVDSLRSQTFQNFELILVDDGSTDGAEMICDQCAGEDPRILVIHKQNEGLIKTWIRGVASSRAPYLMFIDSDDWLELNCLEEMRNHLAEGRQVICSGYLIEREWNHTSEKKDNIAAPGIYEGEKLEREIKEKLLGNEERTLILSRCMKLFSRELIEDNIHFCDAAIRMGEDLTITVPAFLDADRVVVMKEAFFYHYRFVHRSMAHQYDAGMYDNMLKLRSVLLSICREKGADPGMVSGEFLFLFLLVLKNEIRKRAGFEEVSKRIKKLCLDVSSETMLRAYDGRINSPANRMLAWIMKKPSTLRIAIIRLIFQLKG